MAIQRQHGYTYIVVQVILNPRDDALLRQLAQIEGDSLSATVRALIRAEARRRGLALPPLSKLERRSR